jgi:hypothetical protein
MNKVSDTLKIDVGLAPVSLATTNATGDYLPMANYRRILFLVNAAAMAVTKTVVAQLYQATDADGTSAKVITGATITITANTKVKAATVTLATFTAGNVIVINGLTFTAHASTTTKSTRNFSIAGSDTQDGDELVSCINDATYGVPGVVASNSSGTVTLKATDAASVTVVGVVTIGVAATLRADGFVEVSASDLDTVNGFDHVAVKLTTDATIVVGASAVRGSERYTPVQFVGGSYAS